MKTKNRVLSAVLAAAMTLPLAACGGGSTGGKTEKITVWTNDAGTKEFMTQMVQEYNEGEGKEKGIMIEYTVYGGDYATTADMAFANDRAPDILHAQGSLKQWVEKGYLMPIDDLPGMDELIGKYEESDLTSFTVNDRVYAVPSMVTAIGMIYNKDLFKKAGIVDENGEAKPPVTWAEMVEDAKLITDVQNKIYGIGLPMKWSGFWDYDFGLPAISATGKTGFERETETYNYEYLRKPLEYLLQIKEDKSFYPGPEGLDNDPARAQFAEGLIGMMFAASWDVSVLTNQFPAKCDWGVAPVPVINEADLGKYYYYRFEEASFHVSKEAANKDAEKIAEVYKFFNRTEVLKKLYEEGCIIPFRNDCIDGAQVKDITGWAEFGEIAKSARVPLGWASLKVEGETTNESLAKVWHGTMSVDEFVELRNELANSAYQKGLSEGTINNIDELRARDPKLYSREIN